MQYRIALPVLAAGEAQTFTPPPIVLPSLTPTVEPVVDDRPARIAQFLSGKPLEAEAQMFVSVADEYGIDWRLLPAIAIAESSGGIYACSYNFSGYASCHQGFSSWEECARTSAQLLVALGARDDVHYALRQWVAGDRGAAAGGGIDYANRVRSYMERI